MNKWRQECERILLQEEIDSDIFFQKLFENLSKSDISSFNYKKYYFYLCDIFHLDFLNEYYQTLSSTGSFNLKKNIEKFF